MKNNNFINKKFIFIIFFYILYVIFFLVQENKKKIPIAFVLFFLSPPKLSSLIKPHKPSPYTVHHRTRFL